jgi:hypothetical protein
MAGTGALMFFDLDFAMTTVVHQWFSWIFLAGAAAHITTNFRPFKKHLGSGWGKASLATFGVVLAASFVSWGFVTGPQMEKPIEQALVDAPLSALASVIRATPEALVTRMKEHGITANAQQSVREVSARSGESENRLLAIVFLPEP